MCWNWEVSIIWTVGLALGSLFLLLRKNRLHLRGYDRDRYYALIVLNLAFVQLWEFAIWLNVIPLPENEDYSLCPKWNTIFTSLVYINGVVAWPPIINLFCYKGTQGRKDIFVFTLFFGILYSVLAFSDMIYSTFSLNMTSCSTDGVTFLNWHVALSLSRLLPNGYDWFLFSVAPMLFFKPSYMGWTMATWLFLTFAIPYILLNLGQAASLFCWFGFGLFIMFAAEPYVVLLAEKKFPGLSKLFHKIEQKVYLISTVEPTDHHKLTELADHHELAESKDHQPIGDSKPDQV